MKNLKVLFSVIAFTLGIGGAIASHFAVAQTGYQRIMSGATVESCQNRGVCSDSGSFTCQFRTSPTTTVPLWDTNNPTLSCGDPLQHNVNNGVINP